MNRPPEEFLREAKVLLGEKGWSEDAGKLKDAASPWRGTWPGETPFLAMPGSTAEAAGLVKLCAGHRVAMVPQGGNTGLVGGSIPFGNGDEVILSLGRLKVVRAVDALNDTITVEAGCVLQDVQAAADAADRLFPMRIASEGTCQIGGNLSTNAGGTAVLRYGNMRDLVLGLEVVLPDGTLWEGLRGLRKDNTGYDLKHLFVGAEGTLGVITAAVLKLYPKPADRQVAFAALPDPRAAVELLGLAKSVSGGQVSGFEIMPRLGLDLSLQLLPDARDPMEGTHPWYVLMEFSSGEGDGALRAALERTLELGFEKELVLDAVVAESEAQTAALWALRESLSEAQKLGGGSIKHDVSVPVPLMPDFIAAADAALQDVVPGFRSVAFGHIGDGNVHYNPLQPEVGDKQAFLDRWEDVAHVVHDIVHSMGGSISAEHGLGRLKRDEIERYKSPVELQMMHRIKHVFDPNGIMNPGKLLNF